MPDIAALYTDHYDETEVYRQVSALLDALHVPDDVKPGMKVVLKLNLLTGRAPEYCVTTHPSVVRAVALYLREHGITDITAADSPGGPFTVEALTNIYKACRMLPLEEEGLLKLNRDVSWKTVSCPEGFTVKSFNRISVIADADYVINLAKMKTHGMVRFTCGIKNLFGTIPGLQKPEMHYRYPNLKEFSHMLVELARSAHPAVTLVDAIDAMEGDGPHGGTVRHVGLLLASRDIFTLDYVAAQVAGIDPLSVGMIADAVENGLVKEKEISYPLDTPKPLEVPFALPKATDILFLSRFPAFLRKPVQKVASVLFHPVPKLDPSKCVGCGRCAESCPRHLITVSGGKAHFTRKDCISCFCCQEMCPMKAIGVKRLLG
ncbi:MAG: DUF362 domain-containing protein [Lachnospiraceae bacterium]|nr:DUF362 domain-containing protein [Lachnospiraceae bacterium]